MDTWFDMAMEDEGLEMEQMRFVRKALLQMDRSQTREKGRKRLLVFSKHPDPKIQVIAKAGLASCAYWSGDLNEALKLCQRVTLEHANHPLALWCYRLLISLYKTLGMRRERFDAEGDRWMLMKKMVVEGESAFERIFALNELMHTFEDHDKLEEANRCKEELIKLSALVRRPKLLPLNPEDLN